MEWVLKEEGWSSLTLYGSGRSRTKARDKIHQISFFKAAPTNFFASQARSVSECEFTDVLAISSCSCSPVSLMLLLPAS